MIGRIEFIISPSLSRAHSLRARAQILRHLMKEMMVKTKKRCDSIQIQHYLEHKRKILELKCQPISLSDFRYEN